MAGKPRPAAPFQGPGGNVKEGLRGKRDETIIIARFFTRNLQCMDKRAGTGRGQASEVDTAGLHQVPFQGGKDHGRPGVGSQNRTILHGLSRRTSSPRQGRDSKVLSVS